MINRRNLIKFLGLAPAVPAMAAFAIEAKADVAVNNEPKLGNELNFVVTRTSHGKFFATWRRHQGDRIIGPDEVSRYEIIAIRPPEQRWSKNGQSWFHIDYDNQDLIAAVMAVTNSTSYVFGGGYNVSIPDYFAVRGVDLCGNRTALSIAKAS